MLVFNDTFKHRTQGERVVQLFIHAPVYDCYDAKHRYMHVYVISSSFKHIKQTSKQTYFQLHSIHMKTLRNLNF